MASTGGGIAIPADPNSNHLVLFLNGSSLLCRRQFVDATLPD
jgi:hypothetical protein